MIQKATPDSFVILVACPWAEPGLEALREAFAEHWSEELSVHNVPGAITLSLGDDEATLAFDEPIPELADLAPTTLEPYGPAEVELLRAHQSLWRLTLQGGTERGLAPSIFGAKLMSALMVAGGSGVFLPMTMRLHSPRTIQRQTMDPEFPPAITNLYVNCWDQEGWMRTRGLTAFGLPELETPVTDGLNAAYFRLMDVAANMIAQGFAFPNGGQILAGPQIYEIKDGPAGPADEKIPMAGHFGVQTLRPTLPTRKN